MLEYRDNQDNLIQAKRKARAINKSWIERIMLGLHPREDLTSESVVDDFLS